VVEGRMLIADTRFYGEAKSVVLMVDMQRKKSLGLGLDLSVEFI
jgi:hypothetical protein